MGGDFIPDLYVIGAVHVTIKGSTLTNTTDRNHIFYNGEIDRIISDGLIFTEGQGTESNWLIAAANQYGGPLAFEATDAAMLVFSTADQLSHGMLVQLMNALPPQP